MTHVPSPALMALAFGALLSACATTPIGYEPGTTAAERDSLHRSTAVPTVEANESFISHTVEADIAVAPGVLLPWLVNVPLERVLPGTESLPGVERTDLLSASWGTPGTRRRVVQRDGNTALEELLAVEEGRRFQYVVWNFTNDGRRAVRYAVGEFLFTPTPSGAHLRWTYRFRGRGWPTTGFLESFVEKDYAAFMQVAMERIKTEAEKDLLGRTP